MLIKLSGTGHEGRPALLRTLRVGSTVTLKHEEKNLHDENAMAVIYRKRQIGWIPRSANLALLAIEPKKSSIKEVGTDETGRWSHIVIEVLFHPNTSAARLVSEHGLVVASILQKLNVKDVRVARKIADLPTLDHQDSIEEWNAMNGMSGFEEAKQEQPHDVRGTRGKMR